MIDKYNAKENHCQQKNPQKIPRAKRQSRSATGEILARPASRAGVRVSLRLFLDASGCIVLQSLRIAWQALMLGASIAPLDYRRAAPCPFVSRRCGGRAGRFLPVLRSFSCCTGGNIARRQSSCRTRRRDIRHGHQSRPAVRAGAYK